VTVGFGGREKVGGTKVTLPLGGAGCHNLWISLVILMENEKD